MFELVNGFQFESGENISAATELPELDGVRVSRKRAESFLGKTNIPGFDYALNPYVGCDHACKFCYAAYMDNFTGNPDKWGTYIDVKLCREPLGRHRLVGRRVIVSSVTDPYNGAEETCLLTRRSLELLSEAGCHVLVLTKSARVLRDLELLQDMPDVMVGMSVYTLDNRLREGMDKASSVEARLSALSELYVAGIPTALFCSPMFPELTDWQGIVEKTSAYVDKYWFEPLNLRWAARDEVLSYIRGQHRHLYPLYLDVYSSNKKLSEEYWQAVKADIDDYFSETGKPYEAVFHRVLPESASATGDEDGQAANGTILDGQCPDEEEDELFGGDWA